MVSRASVLVLTASAATIVALPLFAASNPSSGPIARYDVRAGTVSGMGAMGAGSMMGMMFGGRGGNSAQHELYLRLGSSQAATKGAPKAEHFMPPAAKLGKSVLLTTPQLEKAEDVLPQKPKGRLLLYWGCGLNAPKGQPVVIDFAKLAAGQMPSGLWTTTILRDWGPSASNSKTFGRWPAEDGKYVKADSSFVGAHRIVSNYGPEIAFSAAKDFMQPLSVTTRQQAGGATVLNWSTIPEATGYLAFITGGKMGQNGEMGDMVMWTSSSSRQFGGGLSDWLSPSTVANLIKDKTVMPPTTTSCVVPIEVRQATPDFRMGTLTAFGPEENFSYPPRPTEANKPWNLEWTARIRHRSSTSWMEAQGMTMGSMNSSNESTQGSQKKCKPKGGFGGMLGGIMGGGSGC